MTSLKDSLIVWPRPRVHIGLPENPERHEPKVVVEGQVGAESVPCSRTPPLGTWGSAFPTGLTELLPHVVTAAAGEVTGRER